MLMLQPSNFPKAYPIMDTKEFLILVKIMLRRTERMYRVEGEEDILQSLNLLRKLHDDLVKQQKALLTQRTPAKIIQFEDFAQLDQVFSLS